MDMRELVERLVEEVLARLHQGDKPREIVVLGEPDEAVAARIRDDLAEEVRLVFCGHSVPQNPQQDTTRYVLPFLSCSDMADLAAGKAATAAMEAVLGLLLAGRAVEVLEFGYRSWSATAPHALYRLYEGYEKILAEYGLTEFRPPVPHTVRLRDALVTEHSVRQAAEQGAQTLAVPLRAIVTPLAADAARELHITILRQQ